MDGWKRQLGNNGFRIRKLGMGSVWRVKKITWVTQQRSWVSDPGSFNARGYSQPRLPLPARCQSHVEEKPATAPASTVASLWFLLVELFVSLFWYGGECFGQEGGGCKNADVGIHKDFWYYC